MQRAIFLDRDNTILDNDGYLGDPAEVVLCKGAASAIASLRGLGYKIVVVTNQSGVARGLFTEADVQAVHNRISELIEKQANGASIDAFYYCPYLPGAQVAKYDQAHPWRKPEPGMLLAAAEEMKLDLSACWMVGDAGRDTAAGKAAGVRTVLLGEHDPATDEPEPDYTAASMTEAARIIAQHLGRETEAPADERTPVVTKTRAAKTEEPNPNAAPTYPAVTSFKPTDPNHRPAQRQSNRPFKPWSIQPVSGAAPSPTQSSEPKRRSTTPPAQPAAAGPPPEEPVEEDGGGSPRTDRLLNQILRQLKANHADYGDWSMYKVAAVGLAQPAALACVLIGTVNNASAAEWLIGAVFCQLAVITGLLLHAQR